MLLDFGAQQAVGAEHAGRWRNQNRAHAEFKRHRGGMDGAGAAESHQGEFRRIAAALDRHRFDRAHQVGIRDLMYAVSRFMQRQLGRAADVPQYRVFREIAPDAERAARQRVFVQIAEHQIRVGHGRPFVAASITGRPRHRPGAARPDAQRTAGIHGGNAAAASADFRNINHRYAQRVAVAAHQTAAGRDRAADFVFGRAQHFAVFNDRGLGRGAAHVERDHVAVAAGLRDLCRGNNAGGRAGLDDGDRAFRRETGTDESAVRLHHQYRRGNAAAAQPLAQAVEVGGDQRRDVRVDHGGAGALVLEHFRQHLVRQRNPQCGKTAFQ